MVEKYLEILEHARRALEQEGVQVQHRQEVLALLGVLLRSLDVYPPAEQDGEVLASALVSSQAMLALLKQQTAELDALRKLSIKLTSSLDMATVLDTIVREAMQLMQDPWSAYIFLYRNGVLEFGSALSSDGNGEKAYNPRPNGLTYSVARTGETIIVDDLRQHPLFATAPEHWAGSIIGMPLKVDGKVVGVMNLSRFSTGGFSEAEKRTLNILADQAAIAISNASLHQSISRKAYSDTVTGLPNRRALDKRLERELALARRTDQSFAVVMMDLDGFKTVNDTYGHDVGDQVLRVFFNYMVQGLRTSDFLARYGGDELTLIMSQTSTESALLVTDKLVEKVEKFAFTTSDGARIGLGISGGIAIYPLHGRNGADLLRAADTALYRAKRHQRGKFVLALGLTGPLPTLSPSDTQPNIPIGDSNAAQSKADS